MDRELWPSGLSCTSKASLLHEVRAFTVRLHDALKSVRIRLEHRPGPWSRDSMLGVVNDLHELHAVASYWSGYMHLADDSPERAKLQQLLRECAELEEVVCAGLLLTSSEAERTQ